MTLRTLSLTLLALCIVLPAVAQQSGLPASSYVPVTAFDPARNAEQDISNAVSEAGRTGRRVLLDVGGEWCVWCRRLDTLFATHKDLIAFRDGNYVTVKINYSKENKNEKVLARYPKIPGYPHIFVLEKDGTLLHSQDTGELESGKGHDPEKVMTFLKTWAPEHKK